jgi:hypothetical protein
MLTLLLIASGWGDLLGIALLLIGGAACYLAIVGRWLRFLAFSAGLDLVAQTGLMLAGTQLHPAGYGRAAADWWWWAGGVGLMLMSWLGLRLPLPGGLPATGRWARRLLAGLGIGLLLGVCVDLQSAARGGLDAGLWVTLPFVVGYQVPLWLVLSEPRPQDPASDGQRPAC